MTGIGAIALGAAPAAGGLLFGALAGNATRGDPRADIKEDLELLERLPADQVDRRAALISTIASRIDALITASEQSRKLRSKTSYFTGYFTERGHWRELAVFIMAVLFAVVCWGVDHHRADWLPMFVATILAATVTGLFVLGGFVRSVRATPQPPQPTGR